MYESQSDFKDKVSETNIEQIAKDKVKGSIDSQSDYKDKVSVNKIEQTAKKELNVSVDSQTDSNEKVSKYKTKQITKKEINTSINSQFDLNEKKGANQAVGNFEPTGNENDQKIMKQDASNIIMEQYSLFDQLTSYLEHNYIFLVPKLDEIYLESID